jgi:hypothetical protein
MRVLDGREPFDGAAAHSPGRRVGRHELRVRLLDRLELVHQRVEPGVADLGIVVDVVPLFVMADQVAELGGARGGRRGHGA